MLCVICYIFLLCIYLLDKNLLFDKNAILLEIAKNRDSTANCLFDNGITCK